MTSQKKRLMRMIQTNRPLARRAKRYLVEANNADHDAYVDVLKLIRKAKIYSKKTNATGLQMAFLSACDAAEKTVRPRPNIRPRSDESGRLTQRDRRAWPPRDPIQRTAL